MVELREDEKSVTDCWKTAGRWARVPQPSPLLLAGLIVRHLTLSISSSLFRPSLSCPPNWWAGEAFTPFLFFLYLSFQQRWRLVKCLSFPLPVSSTRLFLPPASPQLFFSSLFIKFLFRSPERRQRLQLTCRKRGVERGIQEMCNKSCVYIAISNDVWRPLYTEPDIYTLMNFHFILFIISLIAWIDYCMCVAV